MTKVTSGTLDALRAIPYLREVPATDLAALARVSIVREFARGRAVFDEDAPAAGIFVVRHGRVKLVRRSPGGREQILHVEGPGATLAEVPTFDGGGYVATAVAVDDVRVLFVPRRALLDLCRRRPAVALGVILVLARRLRGFAGLIEDLALREVAARVARWLLAEMERTGGDVVRLGSREDVAARVGTVRELVSRSLTRLERAGTIERRGRNVRVRDARGLRALADAGRARGGEDNRPRGG